MTSLKTSLSWVTYTVHTQLAASLICRLNSDFISQIVLNHSLFSQENRSQINIIIHELLTIWNVDFDVFVLSMWFEITK